MGAPHKKGPQVSSPENIENSPGKNQHRGQKLEPERGVPPENTPDQEDLREP